jgi:hypothetical protein
LKIFSFDSNADEVEDEEKEQEHSSLQEKLDRELKELDRKLEQKEVKPASSTPNFYYNRSFSFLSCH